MICQALNSYTQLKRHTRQRTHIEISFKNGMTKCPKYLFLRHAAQLCIPGGGVRAVIGGGRGKVLKDDWVSLLTQ